MRKIKIDKQLSDRLDTLARQLPPIAKLKPDGTPITRNVQVTGQKMLDDGYTPKTKGEPPINPRLMYLAPVLVFYNHRIELETAYRKSGEVGISNYVTHIKALKTNLDERSRNEVPKETFVKKLFKKLRGK